MAYSLKGRSFVKELDFTPLEMTTLLELSVKLKDAKRDGIEQPRLGGKNIALLFEKTSTRTRAAFEVAAFDQGAHVTYFDPAGSQMGHKESIADTARVLGRIYDALEYRGKHQSDIEVLATNAGVPVYNGLTDEWHPTQMLADYLTMHEASEKPYGELSYAFVGDLRFNMARSHIVMAALMGSDIRLAGPHNLAPPSDVIATAESIAETTGASITVTEDVVAAVRDVDFVHTDVWVSMGESKDVWSERVEDLKPYQISAELMSATGNPHAKFMHCLPAYHDENTVVGRDIIEHTNMPDGLEVTHEVFESSRSIVFEQAENRLHTIKAILVATLVDDDV
ncbi:MAG: ornithine carbamoyltransferase [Acidimicrobiia bacterium]|nr:MAG: ornithine carbamoyltransferase [Acidimicrobiia bacterium]